MISLTTVCTTLLLLRRDCNMKAYSFKGQEFIPFLSVVFSGQENVYYQHDGDRCQKYLSADVFSWLEISSLHNFYLHGHFYQCNIKKVGKEKDDGVSPMQRAKEKKKKNTDKSSANVFLHWQR